jgi:hypothetical protein
MQQRHSIRSQPRSPCWQQGVVILTTPRATAAGAAMARMHGRILCCMQQAARNAHATAAAAAAAAHGFTTPPTPKTSDLPAAPPPPPGKFVHPFSTRRRNVMVAIFAAMMALLSADQNLLAPNVSAWVHGIRVCRRRGRPRVWTRERYSRRRLGPRSEAVVIDRWPPSHAPSSLPSSLPSLPARAALSGSSRLWAQRPPEGHLFVSLHFSSWGGDPRGAPGPPAPAVRLLAAIVSATSAAVVARCAPAADSCPNPQHATLIPKQGRLRHGSFLPYRGTFSHHRESWVPFAAAV